ncbi:S8 family serine peptidase [Pelagibius litoralis]|uniref:S8 family serine peptidase n=1 Tax=Pelagibius litoralis TaxID=374515 RepID=A0A967C1W0_9PROT|nr:S8 family serine peptidase [Pelagibius litoralis]NIA67163.1 S8 family serine peptidase [Pelagibius litoralis]
MLGALRFAGFLAVALSLATTATAQNTTHDPRNAPRITGIGVISCVEPGDRIVVKGSNFGRAGGKSLILKDSYVRVELPVTRWTDRSIVATLPRHSALSPGAWYQLGIENKRSGEWTSAQRRPLQICAVKDTDTQVDASGNPIDPGRGTGTPDRRPVDPPREERPTGTKRPSTATPGTPPQQPPGPSVPNLPPLAVPGTAAADQEDDEVLAITGTLAEATALAQQLTGLGYAVRSLQELPVLGFALVRLGIPGGQDVPASLDTLRQSFPATLFDANTLYAPQAAAEPRHYARELIGWPDVSQACRLEVDVGLIDTAVDRSHPALRDSSVLARNFLTAGLKPAPPDHGTAVASLIVGDPASNTSGLVPSARLYAAAIFGLRDNDRVVGTTDAIARAIDWLGQQGVRIVNLSLSGPGNQVLRLTARRAHESGMILIAAAGNEGPNAAPVFPAGYQHVVAVTAIDAALQPYSEANRGGYIDIAAPGVDVWSARSGKGGRYSSGTSFAAPFVAAAAALVLAQDPDITPTLLGQKLTGSARDLGAPGRDSTFGWGLLQPLGGC